MSEITGTVTSITLQIEYSNGGTKTVTIPKEECDQLGAMILKESAIDKISQGEYTEKVKDGFAPQKAPATAGSELQGHTVKNTLALLYDHDKEDNVISACGPHLHPPHWEVQ